MTTLTLVKFAFNLALVLLGVFAIYKEKELIKFERKVKKYVKAFFKAVYYTIMEKKNQKKEGSKRWKNGCKRDGGYYAKGDGGH